jgi:hypothetical protein
MTRSLQLLTARSASFSNGEITSFQRYYQGKYGTEPLTAFDPIHLKIVASENGITIYYRFWLKSQYFELGIIILGGLAILIDGPRRVGAILAVLVVLPCLSVALNVAAIVRARRWLQSTLQRAISATEDG